MTERILLIGGCGYIGSALYQFLKAHGQAVDTIDLEWRGNKVNPDNIKMDYTHASKGLLASYDIIFWFAGHASVAIAQRDPEGALLNNTSHLFSLANKLSPAQRLIYASSASIYNGVKRSGGAREEDVQSDPQNAYDISKFFFDRMMEIYGGNFAGLRLGTLAGSSPNRRDNLILNAMAKSAFSAGKVKISNASRRRSILGMPDLMRAAKALMEKPELEAGFYNLASFQCSVGELGKLISDRLNVPLVEDVDMPGYDYLIATDKFCKAFDFTFAETPETLTDAVIHQMGEEREK